MLGYTDRFLELCYIVRFWHIDICSGFNLSPGQMNERNDTCFFSLSRSAKKWRNGMLSLSSQPTIDEATRIFDQEIRSYFSCHDILKYVGLNWCISRINSSERSYPSNHSLSHRYIICQHFFGFHSPPAARLVVVLSIGWGAWELFTVWASYFVFCLKYADVEHRLYGPRVKPKLKVDGNRSPYILLSHSKE